MAYFDQIEKTEINEFEIGRVEKDYHAKLPLGIKKILSYAKGESFLPNGYRLLTIAEVLAASEELNVDFVKKNLLPVIDCGDNDFIVYHLKEGYWAKFNIVDGTIFKRKSSVKELVN